MADAAIPLPDFTAAGEDALRFAVGAARVAADHKCEDVVVLDLRGVSTVADVFVVATGTSDRQMSAVLSHIEDYARSVGRSPFRVAGAREGKWALADYVDVVVHVLDHEHRAFYDLESLWGDAPRVVWNPAPNGTPPPPDA